MCQKIWRALHLYGVLFIVSKNEGCSVFVIGKANGEDSMNRHIVYRQYTLKEKVLMAVVLFDLLLGIGIITEGEKKYHASRVSYTQSDN